jgi:hypothetical protein
MLEHRDYEARLKKMRLDLSQMNKDYDKTEVQKHFLCHHGYTIGTPL